MSTTLRPIQISPTHQSRSVSATASSAYWTLWDGFENSLFSFSLTLWSWFSMCDSCPSFSEGSGPHVASQRPGQLGSEDLRRLSAQASRPKRRQGRRRPEAERPQVLQRSERPASRILATADTMNTNIRDMISCVWCRVWAAAVVASLADPSGVELHRSQPGVPLHHQHRVLRRAAVRQLPDAAAGNLVSSRTHWESNTRTIWWWVCRLQPTERRSVEDVIGCRSVTPGCGCDSFWGSRNGRRASVSPQSQPCCGCSLVHVWLTSPLYRYKRLIANTHVIARYCKKLMCLPCVCVSAGRWTGRPASPPGRVWTPWLTSVVRTTLCPTSCSTSWSQKWWDHVL